MEACDLIFVCLFLSHTDLKLALGIWRRGSRLSPGTCRINSVVYCAIDFNKDMKTGFAVVINSLHLPLCLRHRDFLHSSPSNYGTVKLSRTMEGPAQLPFGM